MRKPVTLLILVLFLVVSCGNPPKPTPILPSATPELIEKGKYLVKTLAACGFCHGETADPSAALSGGRVVWDNYGEVQAPNITTSMDGIGSFSTQQVIAAIRASVAPGDRKLSPYSHRGYEWLSDQDAVAITGYLQTLPGVNKQVQKRDLGFMSRNTTGLFEKRMAEVPPFVPPIPRAHEVAFGKYLVDNVARCGTCHHTQPTLLSEGKYLGGSNEVTIAGKTKLAPNITGSEVYGLGKWQETEIVRYLRTGISPDKRRSDPDFCPIKFYAKATDADLLAIARFLKTVAFE